jgi:4-hydroxy-3-methylbut-2-en-1-yl diphosphate reductase
MDGHRSLLVAAPMRLEALALRGAVPGARVLRIGMGPRRAQAAAAALVPPSGGWALAVTGLCGGLDPALEPGDIVVASEVRGLAGPGGTGGTDGTDGTDGTVECPSAGLLAAALQRRGLRPRVGPVTSADHVVQGAERARLLATGAVAVDMESAWIATAARGGTPFAVLRVVLDAPGSELKRVGLAAAAVRALRTLRRAAPALADWSAANATTMHSASGSAMSPEEVD